MGAGGDRAADLLRTFNAAIGLHQAGRLTEAIQLYERLHRQLPRHPDVLDYYGTARHQLGDNRAALTMLSASTRLRPLSAATRNRLGAVQRALGDRRSAVGSFRRAALAEPGIAEPGVNLAAMLQDEGSPERALEWARRVLAAQPNSFDAVVRRGAAYNALGRFEDAARDLERARRAQPANPEVCLQLALALVGTGDNARAYDAVRAGIVATPAAYELYGNLIGAGAPLFEDGALASWALRALALNPLSARLRANAGVELYRDSQPAGAVRAATRALLLDPSLEAGLQTLAAAAFQCNRPALARAAARHGLAAHPGNADIAYALAEVEFVSGDLAHAWELYESRVGRSMFRPRLSLPPLWQGPGTENGPLLIASEQGVGDELIFLSCLPDLRRQVRVPLVVEVDQRIVTAVSRSFPDIAVIPRQLVPGDARGQFFDYAEATARHGLRQAVFAGSLPRFFRRDRDRPTPQGGYLQADPERVAHWRAELARLRPDRAVGVVWRSALMTKYRARHHAGILDWAPVFRTPGCAFVNLMHGDVQPELDLLREREGVEVQRLPGIDLWNDIDDLLALLAAFDVVVAARTANCAFAAAVGTPTIRVAQSFNRISDGRDFFFSNVWPTLKRDAPFEAGPAAEAAARLLRERIAAA
ncbi:hypothetical protein [Thalassobaculum sp.]|uniref:tetratricopeptide repeat protein n=1 Tax=Thalassobaculum sp. TaxID=2022740 RepID=UPI0032ECB0D5